MAERLARFWKLHGSARKGHLLSPAEREEYRALLESFLRASTGAQNLAVVVKHDPRTTPRVRRAVQAELRTGGAPIRTMTFDVGLGGFSALVPSPPATGAIVEFTLRLARGNEVVGRARVVGTRARGREARTSFAYQDLQLGSNALEAFIVEALLGDLVPGSQYLEDVSSILGGGVVTPLAPVPPPAPVDPVPRRPLPAPDAEPPRLVRVARLRVAS